MAAAEGGGRLRVAFGSPSGRVGYGAQAGVAASRAGRGVRPRGGRERIAALQRHRRAGGGAGDHQNAYDSPAHSDSLANSGSPAYESYESYVSPAHSPSDLSVQPYLLRGADVLLPRL